MYTIGRGPVVTGAGAASGTGLAFTGFPVLGFAIVGVTVVVVGLILLRVAMMRRTRSAKDAES
jgi:hypothetical protein